MSEYICSYFIVSQYWIIVVGISTFLIISHYIHIIRLTLIYFSTNKMYSDYFERILLIWWLAQFCFSIFFCWIIGCKLMKSQWKFKNSITSLEYFITSIFLMFSCNWLICQHNVIAVFQRLYIRWTIHENIWQLSYDTFIETHF